MLLLPPFCAEAFVPSITPRSMARQARRMVMASLKQGRRLGAAGCPIEQLDGMCTRNASASRDIADAAEIAGGDDVGPHAFDVGDLAVAQAPRQLGLQHLVGAGPAATNVPLGHIL